MPFGHNSIDRSASHREAEAIIPVTLHLLLPIRPAGEFAAWHR